MLVRCISTTTARRLQLSRIKPCGMAAKTNDRTGVSPKRKASGPPKVMRSTLTPTALTTEKPWFHDGYREEYGKDDLGKGATAGKDNTQAE